MEVPLAVPPPPNEAPLANLAYRGLTVALSALALVGQIAYLDVLYWNALGIGRMAKGGLHPALLSAVVTGSTVIAVAAAVGVMMVFRGDGSRGARPFGLALSAWAYMLAYSGLTILLAPGPDSGLHLPFDAHFLFVEALGLAALIRFTAKFPIGVGPEAFQDPQTLPVGLRGLQTLRLRLLTPRGPFVAGLLAPALILGVNAGLGRPAEDAALLPLTDVCRLAAIAVVVLNMRGSFVTADTEGRRRMLWFVVGFTLLLGAVGTLLGGNVLTAVTEWEMPGFNWRPVVLNLGVLGLIWGAAMGIFYRGPIKPGRVSRRAAVASAALTVALFLSAGLESLAAGGVTSAVTLPRGIGIFVGFLTLGILYARARRPVEGMIYQAWADRSPGADDR
ncbi:MAG: hypothetical protein Q8N53_17130 [Longimicrobiales bacterium]|nr:hypothetical protein [Longimicrobiales bacterium]